jgi:hypothetical protein
VYSAEVLEEHDPALVQPSSALLRHSSARGVTAFGAVGCRRSRVRRSRSRRCRRVDELNQTPGGRRSCATPSVSAGG